MENSRFKVSFFRTYVTTIYVNATDETEAILYAHPELDEQELEQMNVQIEDIEVSRVDKVVYPFQEGDTYYTIEPDGDIVESYWDDESEKLHTPDRVYFSTKEEAEAFLRN